MPVNPDKKDLRNIKTEKALNNAMISLLGRQKFEKITAKDICDEAFIKLSLYILKIYLSKRNRCSNMLYMTTTSL